MFAAFQLVIFNINDFIDEMTNNTFKEVSDPINIPYLSMSTVLSEPAYSNPIAPPQSENDLEDFAYSFYF